MPTNISINSIFFGKSFFTPTEQVRWTVTLSTDLPVKIVLIYKIKYLDRTLAETHQEVELKPGTSDTQLSWQPPMDAPRGYGLDVRLETSEGKTIQELSTSFDVLEHWTQNPRYGFMTDFSPNRTDGKLPIETLKSYHINGLQFYDWMYRHDTYLPIDEPFIDPLGRKLSLNTTKKLIEIAHQNGIAAMPYTAVYAASIPFFEQHKDWALYDDNGEPVYFGENFLVIMDPRRNSPWTNHLLQEFAGILNATGFDGIHLDQYGAPKDGYDVHGDYFQLDKPLADLINQTADIVEQSYKGKGAVIFNAVTNWPIEQVASSAEDLVYIEVWSPYTKFSDLWSLINQAQQLGRGKPVVIAAYIHPAYEINARLMDAIIFASGASHIELGEQGGYLADPYFPKYEIPSAQLSTTLKRYYDFSVRYQNVIGPDTKPGVVNGDLNLSIQNAETAREYSADRVMSIWRESVGYTAISLVNLIGIEHDEWERELSNPPTVFQSLEIHIAPLEKQVGRVWFATPDRDDLALQEIPFQQHGDTVTLSLPLLDQWSLILVEWDK